MGSVHPAVCPRDPFDVVSWVAWGYLVFWVYGYLGYVGYGSDVNRIHGFRVQMENRP